MKLTFVLFLLITFAGCQAHRPTPMENTDSGTTETHSGPIPKEGLHNVFRITDNLFSGSSPEGDVGFRSLQEMGIQTILSVDGARPDITRARKYGMRYVHLPFGYDGIPRQQSLRLARAVRDLPGPVYVHCHHGKHRGPTAAAVIHLCLDEKCSIEQALAEMRRAGTDPHYTGLFAAPRTFMRPVGSELDEVSADFPEVAPLPGLAQAMVQIDARWDNLKRIQSSGWKNLADHADIDPPHEALQLVEQYREASRLEQVTSRPEEFRRWLADAADKAEALEKVLRLAKKQEVDKRRIDEAFRAAESSCLQCHTRYRDVPH